MHHLPRLDRKFYQSFAVVHWTITFEDRSTGWLDEAFHAFFRELLLHAAARQGLFCPAYCLMPDHIHLMWMGMKISTDQIVSMRFLRTHLATEFERSSRPTIQSNSKSNRMTMFSARKIESETPLPKRAFTFCRIRLRRNLSPKSKTGTGMEQSCRAIPRSVRCKRSSGRCFGSNTRNSGRQHHRSAVFLI